MLENIYDLRKALDALAAAANAAPVVVLRGLPGSGKTFVADRVFSRGGFNKFSADLYFTHPLSGEYRFVPEKLGQAHAACLRTYLLYVTTKGVDLPLVVDNTNLREAEFAPYVAAGLAHGRPTVLVTVETPFRLCLDRQTHAVSEASMEGMLVALRATSIPSWYTHWRVAGG